MSSNAKILLIVVVVSAFSVVWFGTSMFRYGNYAQCVDYTLKQFTEEGIMDAKFRSEEFCAAEYPYLPPVYQHIPGVEGKVSGSVRSKTLELTQPVHRVKVRLNMADGKVETFEATNLEEYFGNTTGLHIEKSRYVMEVAGELKDFKIMETSKNINEGKRVGD